MNDSFASSSSLRLHNSMDGIGVDRDSIKLRMWVFKLTSTQFDVCVEGYRPKDVAECELKCWHSTSIIDRVNSRNLRSSSGSVYFLQGYPHSLIEQFNDGFPPDWRKILLDFYRSIVQTDHYDVSQWFNSSTTVEHRRRSSDVSRRASTTNLLDSVSRWIEPKQQQQQHPNQRQRSSRISTNRRFSTAPMMTPVAEERDFGDNSDSSHDIRMLPSIRKTAIRKEKIVDEDEDGLMNEQESITHYDQDEIVNNGNESIDSGRLSTNSPAILFKVPFAPQSIHRKMLTMSDNQDVTQNSSVNNDSGVDLQRIVPNVIFRDWIFKLVYATFDVCIEGYRLDVPDKCWHSTSIVCRLDSNLLKSKSGTIYGLDGPIDMKSAVDTYGYPDDLIAQFKYGFPPNWHQILEDYHCQLMNMGRDRCNISQWFDSSINIGSQRSMNIGGNRSMNIMSTTTTTATLNDAVDRWNVNHQTTIIQRNERIFSSATTTNARRRPMMPMTPLVEERNQSIDNMSTDSSLSRTRSGRIVKPPLAGWALQRITYDIYGNARHLSDATTKTAIDDSRASQTLSALSDMYNLSPKHCATQQERRRSLVQQSTKNRQSAKKVRKIVSYSSSEDDNDENDESPIIIRRQKPSRFRLDDSVDEEMVELERRQRDERRRLKKKIEKKHRVANRKRERIRSPPVHHRSPKKSRKNHRKEAIVTSKPPKRTQKRTIPVESPPPPPIIHKAPTKKRWLTEEYKRLQIALRAIAPRNDVDWNKVARSIGGGRSGGDCRIAANRMFAYDMQVEGKQHCISINDDSDEKTRLQQQRKRVTSAIPQITARVGTAAYQVQAHRLLDRYKKKNNNTADDDDDLFDEAAITSSMINMPSLADLNPNDSLLSVMITPTNVPRGKNRAFVPRPVSMTPANQQQHRYQPSPISPIDSAQRDRTARYVHHLMQDKHATSHRMMNQRKPQPKSRSAAGETSHQVFERRMMAEEEEEEEHDDDFSSDSDQYFSEN